MDYILMNKNTEVMKVSKDINDIVFQDIGDIYNIEYAPLVFEGIMREKGLLIPLDKGIESMIEKAKKKKEQYSHVHEGNKKVEKIR